MSDEAHQVERTLKLAAGSAQQQACDILRGLDGVMRAIPQGATRLRIIYDFTQVSWAQLCEALVKAGLYSQKRWLARWYDSWRDQLDHNMRENLTHKAACCSKPPPGAGRK